MHILIANFEVSVLEFVSFDARFKFRIYAAEYFNCCSVENRTTQ
jgi:hypothetical protein